MGEKVRLEVRQQSQIFSSNLTSKVQRTNRTVPLPRSQYFYMSIFAVQLGSLTATRNLTFSGAIVD
jgi:hypothetical protein